MNKKTAIIVSSFGTAHLETLKSCIAPVEDAIAARLPGCRVYRAFTGRTVVRKLREKYGIETDSLPEALARAAADGFDRAVVQPTLFMKGIEYELVRREASSSGMETAVGRPLISSNEDVAALAELITAENHLEPGEGLVLMGHGTRHSANGVYPALQELFARDGKPIFVATVDGEPTFDAAAERLKAAGMARARLLPLMLVAGEHAKSDMAGDGDDSLISVLRRAGVEASPVFRGLGESERVRKIFADRAEAAVRAMG